MPDRVAVQELLDLTGLTGPEADRALAATGFVFDHVTRGGYALYVHVDGSEVWIKPDGEVVRLGPKIRGRAGKKYHPRFDQAGERTRLHSTGEKLFMGR